MTILDDTRALLAGQRDKLQAERDRLATERETLTAQIGEVDALIRQLGGSQPTRATVPTTGRRSGIRDQVLDAVRSGNATPSEVRKALSIADGDKSGAGAVANALSALKRDGKVSMNKGVYTAAP